MSLTVPKTYGPFLLGQKKSFLVGNKYRIWWVWLARESTAHWVFAVREALLDGKYLQCSL
jgi:hypothetical protein